MERLRLLWREYVDQYQMPIVRLLLGAALVTSILINTQAISPGEGWVLSMVLFAILLFAGQLDNLQQSFLRPKVKFYPMHNAQYTDDMSAVLSQNEVAKARLLEFSTDSIHTNLLREMVSRNYTVQLLVSHPNAAPNVYQQQTLEKYVRELALIKEQYTSPQMFEVRCYEQPASLRGRKIGNAIITISWFTYGRQRIERTNMSELLKQARRPYDLEGHTNVLISASLSSNEGRILESMFDRVFDDIWHTATPLEEVVEKLS